jgi:hypothetical protein
MRRRAGVEHVLGDDEAEHLMGHSISRS